MVAFVLPTAGGGVKPILQVPVPAVTSELRLMESPGQIGAEGAFVPSGEQQLFTVIVIESNSIQGSCPK